MFVYWRGGKKSSNNAFVILIFGNFFSGYYKNPQNLQLCGSHLKDNADVRLKAHLLAPFLKLSLI